MRVGGAVVLWLGVEMRVKDSEQAGSAENRCSPEGLKAAFFKACVFKWHASVLWTACPFLLCFKY